MKFKKFISTLITLAAIAIAVSAVVKRILIHGDDLKNIIRHKHDVIKDVGINVPEKKKSNDSNAGVNRPIDSSIPDTLFDQEAYMFKPRSLST